MSEDVHLGLFRIGAQRFAISSANIWRVVFHPALSALTGGGPCSTGAFRFEDLTVPVYDIAALSGGDACTRSMIVVLRHEQMVMGIEIDEIHKTIRPIAIEQIQSSSDGAAVLTPSVFWDPAMQTPAGVIDVASLFTRFGLRSLRLPDHLNGDTGTGSEVLNIALFEVGGRSFGVEVASVRAALQTERITPVDMAGTPLYGHHIAQDRHTPIFDLGHLLGLEPRDRSRVPACGLVFGTVDGEDRTMGFRIETVTGAVRASSRTIHPLANSGLSQHRYYRGLLPLAGGNWAIVLDAGRLLEDFGVGRTRRTAAQQAASEARAHIATYVLYRTAGIQLATPLTMLEAVLPLTEHFELGSPGDTFAGVFSWRNRVVNLLRLDHVLGKPEENGILRNVLIARTHEDGVDTFYGFMVGEVSSLASATDEPASQLHRPRLSADCFDRMISIPHEDGRRNILVLDLAKMMREASVGAFAV